MRIASFYYLAYPDTSPADPLNAMSEVYVEVGQEGCDLEHFERTYAVTVCTVGFLKDQLRKHGCFAERSLIVVDVFDDRVIKQALEQLLPDIGSVATEK